jgi:hypothetical protein
MKILQINLIAASLMFLGSLSVNAQTNKTITSTKERTEAKQEIKLLNEIPADKRAVSVQSTVAKKPQRPTPVSSYFQFEKKIMAWTIAGNIPASVPMHVKGQTKDQYKTILMTWGKGNLNLIKEEYHAKILAFPAKAK